MIWTALDSIFKSLPRPWYFLQLSSIFFMFHIPHFWCKKELTVNRGTVSRRDFLKRDSGGTHVHFLDYCLEELTTFCPFTIVGNSCAAGTVLWTNQKRSRFGNQHHPRPTTERYPSHPATRRHGCSWTSSQRSANPATSTCSSLSGPPAPLTAVSCDRSNLPSVRPPP